MPNAMVHAALVNADEMDLVDAILARFEDEEEDEWGGDGESGWDDEDEDEDDEDWDEDEEDWEEDEEEWAEEDSSWEEEEEEV